MRDFQLSVLLLQYFLLLLVVQSLDLHREEGSYVINIDEPSALIDQDIPWSTSVYTKEFQGLEYSLAANETIYSQIFERSPDLNNVYTIPLSESFGIEISNIEVYKKDELLQPGINYEVTAVINQTIIPNNYYQGTNTSDIYMNNISDAQCTYTNQGPRYHGNVIAGIRLTSVVNSYNYNFALKLGSPGITVLKANFDINGSFFGITTENTDMDAYVMPILDNSASSFLTNNLTFTNLFLSRPFYDPLVRLAAVTSSGDVMIFNVFDQDEMTMTIIPDIIIPSSVLDPQVITQFGFYREYYLFSSSNGLNVITKDSNGNASRYFSSESDNPAYNISDFIVNNYTIYAIESNIGLRIFDLVKMKWTSTLLKHPNLSKLDYMTFNPIAYGSPYFVGVAVNNDPRTSVPEIFIEFAANLNYEYTPKVNKIYTSMTKYIINDIASDNIAGLTYIFERERKNLILLTRSVPYVSKIFNYKINLAQYYTFNSDHQEPIFILAEYGNDKLPMVTIKNGDDLITVDRFYYPLTKLECKFNKLSGSNQINFVSYTDCSYSYTNALTYNYQVCPQKLSNILLGSEFDERLDENFAGAGLWVIVAVVVIAIGIIVVIVLCCRCSCSKSISQEKPSQVNTNEQNKYMKGATGDHNEMIEVQIDSNF